MNKPWIGCYVKVHVRFNNLLAVLVFGDLHRYERIHGDWAEIYTLSADVARRVPRDPQGITRVGRDRTDTTGLR